MTILSDSMARDHAETLYATAAASRRARESRQLRRAARRDERAVNHRHADAVLHQAARPWAAMRAWLVAGEL